MSCFSPLTSPAQIYHLFRDLKLLRPEYYSFLLQELNVEDGGLIFSCDRAIMDVIDSEDNNEVEVEESGEYAEEESDSEFKQSKVEKHEHYFDPFESADTEQILLSQRLSPSSLAAAESGATPATVRNNPKKRKFDCHSVSDDALIDHSEGEQQENVQNMWNAPPTNTAASASASASASAAAVSLPSNNARRFLNRHVSPPAGPGAGDDDDDDDDDEPEQATVRSDDGNDADDEQE